jgi:hypothetical protein
MLSDLDAEDADSWRADHPRDCPGVAVGKFGPGYEGYAVSLVRRLGPNSFDATLVLLARRKGGFVVVVLNPDSGPIARAPVVSTTPAGSYEDSERIEKIRTGWPLIIYETIGAGSIAYYWKAGKFRSLTVAE